MFTVKIIRADGSVLLQSFAEFHFVDYTSPIFETYKRILKADTDATDLEYHVSVWAFVEDFGSDKSRTALCEGERIYVTDMSGKTVFSSKGVIAFDGDESCSGDTAGSRFEPECSSS